MVLCYLWLWREEGGRGRKERKGRKEREEKERERNRNPTKMTNDPLPIDLLISTHTIVQEIMVTQLTCKCSANCPMAKRAEFLTLRWSSVTPKGK